MEQMLSTNPAEELSAIRQSCKARQRYAQIQMIALVAMAAVVIAFVLLLMPWASAALAQVDAVVGELASVDFAGMAERVDALVGTKQRQHGGGHGGAGYRPCRFAPCTRRVGGCGSSKPE